jgi:hypothetical protein
VANTGETVLFSGEGQGTSGSGLWFLIVFGVIGALTAGIVSLVGLHVGPWWLWLGVIVGFVFLGRWEMRRSATTIELVEEDGALRVRIQGPTSVDEAIERSYERWTNVITNSVRAGGPMLRYNVAVRTTGGRQIGFHTLGGRMNLPWPERGVGLGNGPDTFTPHNLFLLEKALRAATTGERTESPAPGQSASATKTDPAA